MRMTQDVNVQVLDFPNTKEKEMVTENSDGSYTILLNAKFSYATLTVAYYHAITHIVREDFRKSNVQCIESSAHSGGKENGFI